MAKILNMYTHPKPVVDHTPPKSCRSSSVRYHNGKISRLPRTKIHQARYLRVMLYQCTCSAIRPRSRSGFRYLTGSADGPPPLIHECIPLPRLLEGDVKTHELLTFASIPSIDFDITARPSTAVPGEEYRSSWYMHADWLNDPATSPGMPFINIRTDLLERPIVAHPSDPEHEMVTVWDVLVAVHKAFHAAAVERHRGVRTPNLLDSPGSRGMITLQEMEQIEHIMQGLFNGRSRWAGLSVSQEEHDVWILHVR